MFNNLIESSSHAQEYKRRGSFCSLPVPLMSCCL